MKDEQKIPVIPLLPLGPEGLNQGMIRTDPMGSYTGIPADRDEKPVQDVDDL